MTVLESIFLGLLQGFTEFLPVSSSGHLILAQKLWDIPGNLFFDVMLHLGTLLAVVIAMRKTIWQAIVNWKSKKLLYLIIASVPTFVIALLVKIFVPESLMTQLLPIGFALTIVLIVISHYLAKPKLRLEQSGFLPVIITGLTQGIAVLPGLSRSGSTISVLKLFGVNASDSAEFSFLLSIPVILASAVVEIWEVAKVPVNIPWHCVAIGIVCAFLSGLVAVSMVMKAVKRKSWIAYAIYLVVPLVTSLIVLF
ncbi:MAG: undecaprenyl-diphosphate phosphatase [Clostridia bacterium]|nr:undecaprenyl-diphosphate phosphatase [Clostridia bacterium]